MRALLLSLLCLLLIIGIWTGFIRSAEKLLEELTLLTDLRPLPEEEILARWERLRFRYAIFSDSKRLDEATTILTRALVLFRFGDTGGAEAELSAFRSQLQFLRDQERLTLENII